MDIYIEIDLDNVITVKKLKIPAELKHDIKLYDFIRNYYKSMGYVVGQYIKIC